MINLTKSNAATRIARAITRAAQSPVQTILVTDEQAAELAALGQAFRVGDVIITTDPTVEPPAPPKPEPKPEPKPRPLADLQAERAAQLQDEIRFHVDTLLPPSERESLAALMQKTTLMRLLGAPVDEGASLALVMTLGWAEGALVLGDDVALACRKAQTVEELEAITVDLDTLGKPPTLTAGEIAKALRS
jgi:hypothetical protein